MGEEVWKDIPGYEGLYQVSTTGRIKALERMRKNKRFRKEYILKNHDYENGYKKITLCDNSMKTKRFFVHRLVAMTFIENPNHLPIVNHKDENPSNNNVDNLEWCTYQYNVTYGNRMSKVSGENNKQHKLTKRQVEEIRNKYIFGKYGNGQVTLAKQYGVSRVTIQRIIKGKKWKSILEG